MMINIREGGGGWKESDKAKFKEILDIKQGDKEKAILMIKWWINKKKRRNEGEGKKRILFIVY